MRPFVAEFYIRRNEVRRYIAVLIKSEHGLDEDQAKRHEERTRMFRASALLVLYNAIEASARAGLEAIYDEIAGTNTKFDDLRETIRLRILRDFRTHVGVKRYPHLKEIAIDLISASFDSDKAFSGNVDARELRQQSKDYGFDTETDFQRTRHGADLLTVKNNRNDLAHGTKSFNEVGRNYLITDIKTIARHSMAYMENILLNIDSYLDAGEYRQPAEAA